MQKEFVASIEKMNKASVEAVKRLGEIQLRSIERMTEAQIEATTEYMNQSVKQLQTLAGSKDLQGVVDSQSKFVAGLNEKAVDNAKKTAEILAETKAELSEWVEAGVKAASDTPFAKAVTAAAKKAA
jgi:phasin family protein